jgi:alpha-N-acetylglucosaminidase
MTKRISAGILALAAFCGSAFAATPSIIPQPASMRTHEGVFRITADTTVVAKGKATAEADKLIATLAPAPGFRLKRGERASGTTRIVLALERGLKAELGDEGYKLSVTPERIDLSAADPAGLFYGVQTLRQLLPPEILSSKPADGVEWIIPCVSITDSPRFQWRGLLIDPARHFIPVADVKHHIDAMALHKLNRLQMHLTDNEGWRVEIKKYPKLTELGSNMDWTLRYKKGEGPRRFGFYTQEDIRELVRFAAERHITIVPEIEMPYHAGSAIVGYPEHGVNMKHLAELPVEKRWWARGGDWRPNSGLLGARPETVTFMQDILTEVIELFPSEFIHIGGDEANLKVWAGDPEMQALMKKLGCKDAHGLHSWFIKQMDAFLTKKGRRMVGWDEILQGGLAPGATVMSWRGVGGGIAAAKAGHDVVMAPTSHTYFDYRQAPKELGLGRGVIGVEKVYTFDPIPDTLNTDEARHILGGQGQLWGELIGDPKRRDFMTWPRACALSEVLWSPSDGRNLDLFLIRLTSHIKRLETAGINYRPLDGEPMRWEGKTDTGAPEAAQALVRRLLPDHVENFVFEAIAPEAGRDVFELAAREAKVVIRGNTGVSMAMGLNWYLKEYCKCSVSLRGSNLDLPAELPAVDGIVRKVSWARHRYFLNYCCFGYSLPWWDWEQWERLIDYMALNGINAPLSVTGQEATWQAVCKRLGLGDEAVREFLAGPPYLPFGWMGCLDGWGGPLPQSWIDSHEELGRQILARQRELGMTPIQQGFTGHVPAALKTKYPNAKLHTIRWIEWTTHLLDPLDPLFQKVADVFMQEQKERFGTDHMYAADTFIEMRPPSGDLKYLGNMSKAIYGGMAKNDPEAVWVLQTWIFLNQRNFWTQPRIAAFLGAVTDEQMLCLDLACEDRPQWSRTEAFCGKPWLWCNVQNYGNTVFLGGGLDKNSTGLMAARRSPESGKLAGLGFVNEGLGYNPVAHDLMFEMAWRNGRVDINQWIKRYAGYRYGQASSDAERAWAALKDTVYAAPFRTRSIIDHPPTLGPGRGAPYDNVRLAGAWRSLLDAADDLGQIDTYRFDLVNIARQVLSNHAATLQQGVVKGYNAKDADVFQKASDDFLQLMLELDELLGTRKEFLLGKNLEDAKRWGTTPEEKAILEWNARRVLTLWGQGRAIDDYARKEWSGMIKGYYHARWKWCLSEIGKALKAKKTYDGGTFQAELRKWMVAWSDEKEAYPAEPSGDSIAIAKRLWDKYGDAFKPDSLSLTTGKPTTCSHALPPYPAHLANDGYANNTDRYWATDVAQNPGDAWWQVDMEEPTSVGRIVVVGYYGSARYYGFTVETSLDGETWDTVADQRENKAFATREGHTCRFAPRPVRYIRVTQTHNSANTGRHLVEVMAFPE